MSVYYTPGVYLREVDLSEMIIDRIRKQQFKCILKIVKGLL